jgi:hypothetical protein
MLADSAVVCTKSIVDFLGSPQIGARTLCPRGSDNESPHVRRQEIQITTLLLDYLASAASTYRSADLRAKHVPGEILSRLDDILRPSEVAPIIFIGAKAEDLFSLSSQAQIGLDDGEGAFFTHHG